MGLFAIDGQMYDDDVGVLLQLKSILKYKSLWNPVPRAKKKNIINGKVP